MGWSEVGHVGVLAAPSRGVLRGKVRSERLPEPGEFLARPRPALNLSVDDRPARGLRTARTSQYLHWRFAEHPTAKYLRVDRAESTAVVRPNVRNGRRELVLSDVFGPKPGAAIGAVLAASKAAYVAGWFAGGSPERRAAIRRGLLPLPRLTTLTLVARPLKALSIDVGSLSSWDFASSDLELL
jgi:hypothetical protein